MKVIAFCKQEKGFFLFRKCLSVQNVTCNDSYAEALHLPSFIHLFVRFSDSTSLFIIRLTIHFVKKVNHLINLQNRTYLIHVSFEWRLHRLPSVHIPHECLTWGQMINQPHQACLFLTLSDISFMSVMFVGPLLDLEYLIFLNKLGLFKNTLHKQMTSDEDAWCDEIAIDPVLNSLNSVSLGHHYTCEACTPATHRCAISKYAKTIS